jgi:regulator of PEP synthase PpsR (kinase-PPPase family)
MPDTRLVFCVSDHTGVTAEVFAHSVMARFDDVPVRYVVRSFANNAKRIAEVAAEISAAMEAGDQPIVFSTVTDHAMRDRLRDPGALVLGLFDHFVDELSADLKRQPSTTVGSYHGIRDLAKYQARLDAVDFSLATDDGVGLKSYDEADVVLVGVSRVGKTPTSLFMAMHHGLWSANYPLTGEELDEATLPSALRAHRGKLFALTIDPVRLHQIRQKRRPDSSYADISTCTREVTQAERMFQRERVPTTNTTTQSIEEIAATIMRKTKLPGRLS